MIEMQAGGLTLVFAQVTPQQVLRLAQARPALVLSMSPLALLRDEERPATSSAVFAQLAAAGETLSQTRDTPMTPLMIVRAEDDALAGALYAARLIAPGIYVPPGVLIGLLDTARQAASPGGIPQARLLALVAVLKGWIESMPRLLRGHARDASRARAPDLRMLRLTQRIELELGTQLDAHTGLEQLADDVHSSPAQLTRVFRAVHGLSIARYRRELRLRMALLALLREQPRCQQVARAVGYRSPSQFSADFRALYGIVPSRVTALLASVTAPAFTPARDLTQTHLAGG